MATGHEPVRGPRLLLVAHAFAPASPIGTMRTLRLVRRLDAEGWRATVLMAMPSTYQASMPQDPALLARVPVSTEVLQAPVLRPLDWLASLRPRRMARGRDGASAAAATAPRPRGSSPSGVRALIDEVTSIPDKEIGWMLPAIVAGLRAIRRQRPVAVYSTAPPWTGQLVAYALARLSGLPWVADFRDPWARAPWRENQPGRIRSAAVSLETRVIARADAILFATRGNYEEYAAHYGDAAAAKFHVVPNGCDPEEFTGIEPATASGRFVLVHAGSLYGGRTPVPLFRAIASAIASGRLRRDEFRLRLIGATVGDAGLRATVDQLGLADVVEFVPRMPRRDVLREMAAASALLILQPGTTVSVPGKLYEYFALGRPVLALCEEGETAELVRASGVGIAITSQADGAIEEGLLAVVARDGVAGAPPPPDLWDGNRSAARALQIIASVSGTRGMSRNAGPAGDARTMRAEEAGEWRR